MGSSDKESATTSDSERHQRQMDFENFEYPKVDNETNLVAGTRELRKKLDNQDKRCFFSGELLRPEDFSIDHLVPVSGGGDHELKNLVFVTAAINRAKGTMSAEEFIGMCKAVAEVWHNDVDYRIINDTLTNKSRLNSLYSEKH